MNKSGIYQIRNLVDGKKYIGSSVNLGERFLDHRRELNTSKHCNPYLQAAWLKYGESKFTFEILSLCNPSDTLTEEQIAIEIAESECGWDMLYNLSKKAGAPMAGRKHTPESIRKIKEAMSLPRKGRTKDWKHSEEWKEKASKSQKRAWMNGERKASHHKRLERRWHKNQLKLDFQ